MMLHLRLHCYPKCLCNVCHIHVVLRHDITTKGAYFTTEHFENMGWLEWNTVLGPKYKGLLGGATCACSVELCGNRLVYHHIAQCHGIMEVQDSCGSALEGAMQY